MEHNNKNAHTLRFLKAQGYPIRAVRSALAKLAGWEHGDLASAIGAHRTVVTNTLNGIRKRAETRAGIAGCLEVPVEELFDEPDEPAVEAGLQQGEAGG